MIWVVGALPALALILGGIVAVVRSRGIFERSHTDFPPHVVTAAFRFIGMDSPWPSYLGGTVGQIASRELLIAAKRKEADGISDAELRECVHRYLDYYETEAIPKWRKELVEQTTKRDLDAYSQKRDEEEEKVKRLLSAALKQGGRNG